MNTKIIEMSKKVIEGGIGYKITDCENVSCENCPFECCKDIDSIDLETAKSILKGEFVDKEKIYCVGGCDTEAKYVCCEAEFCYECLCESFKEDIINILKEKYNMYEIE